MKRATFFSSEIKKHAYFVSIWTRLETHLLLPTQAQKHNNNNNDDDDDDDDDNNNIHSVPWLPREKNKSPWASETWFFVRNRSEAQRQKGDELRMRAATWQRKWFLICVPFHKTTGAERTSEHFRDFFGFNPPTACNICLFVWPVEEMSAWFNPPKKTNPKPTARSTTNTLWGWHRPYEDRWTMARRGGFSPLVGGFGGWFVPAMDFGSPWRAWCTRKDNPGSPNWIYIFLKCFFS